MFCRHRTPRLSEIFGLVGRCITERCSTDVAAAAASSTSLPLKQLPTKELQQLVQNTKAVKALTPSVRRDIRGDHKVEGLQQWEKLDCRVYQPFIAEDIVKQDVFAVIEAGSTQFKGEHCMLKSRAEPLTTVQAEGCHKLMLVPG